MMSKEIPAGYFTLLADGERIADAMEEGRDKRTLYGLCNALRELVGTGFVRHTPAQTSLDCGLREKISA